MANSAKNVSMSLSFSSLRLDENGSRTGVTKYSKDAPSYEALNTMVKELGGDKPVHSVLVANNGLAAVKFNHPRQRLNAGQSGIECRLRYADAARLGAKFDKPFIKWLVTRHCRGCKANTGCHKQKE